MCNDFYDYIFNFVLVLQMTYEKWQPNPDMDFLLKECNSKFLYTTPKTVYPGDTFSDDDETYFILTIDSIYLNERFAVVTCICGDGRLVHTSLDSLSITIGKTKIIHSKDT